MRRAGGATPRNSPRHRDRPHCSGTPWSWPVSARCWDPLSAVSHSGFLLSEASQSSVTSEASWLVWEDPSSCQLPYRSRPLGRKHVISKNSFVSYFRFPPHERTRATSISQMSNAVGIGVSFLLGNFIVSQEDSKSAADSITVLLSVYSGVSILLLVLILAYFPSKPSTPPSNSATETRMDFWQGFKTVIHSRLGVILIKILTKRTTHHHMS